ncbi:MAG: NAD kinase [Candidatus Micrarchaeota archaeon]|nr:MAG: NAD kinase [Candidatus Micrarchaeota archaeon]
MAYLFIDKSKKVDRSVIKRLEALSDDFYFIVGGDGTFIDTALDYNNKIVVPIAAPNRNNSRSLRSAGQMIPHDIEEIDKIIEAIENDSYMIKELPVLECSIYGYTYKTIADFYVERGVARGALRYDIDIKDNSKKMQISAVSNGFIVTTPLGSTGYFSYIDILNKKEPRRIDGIGLAHILPITIVNKIDGKQLDPEVRSIFSMKVDIEVNIRRDADSHLYGIPKIPSGIRIITDKISFRVSKEGVKMLVLSRS